MKIFQAVKKDKPFYIVLSVCAAFLAYLLNLMGDKGRSELLRSLFQVIPLTVTLTVLVGIFGTTAMIYLGWKEVGQGQSLWQYTKSFFKKSI